MKLSKRQINGLIKSAKKWEDIYNEVGVDKGWSNCELCWLYNDNNCKSCPIAIHVKDAFCDNTPYKEWTKHHCDEHNSQRNMKVKCSTCRDLAKEEWDFILSLIP